MRCEDYPCCGHTDGLPCDWTPDYSDPHFLCDHEVDDCRVSDMLDEIFEEFIECASEDCDEDVRDCGHDGRYGDQYDPMEDQWLDGSYEE